MRAQRVAGVQFTFCADFATELAKHGDGVKDVAFNVEDCRGIYQACCAVKFGVSLRDFTFK